MPTESMQDSEGVKTTNADLSPSDVVLQKLISYCLSFMGHDLGCTRYHMLTTCLGSWHALFLPPRSVA